MKFSLTKWSNEWQSLLERIVSKTTWKEDLSRGLKTILTGGAVLADRSFSEVESVRLRYQLEQIEEELLRAYQALGKKSMDHWIQDQDLNEKEKIKLFRQIDDIIKEKEKLLEQMTAVKAPSHQDVSSPPQSVS